MLLNSPPDPAAVRQSALGFTWDRNAAELEAHLRRVLANA
jgi:hypothetical protein